MFKVLSGWCQTDSNQSHFPPKRRNLGGTKQPPLLKCGGSEELEISSGVEVAFPIEEVVDGGMDGGEHLQASHTPEALHRPLSSSKWQV